MTTTTCRRATVLLLALVVVATSLGIPAGLVVVADDLSDTTDQWNGFAAALGGIVAGFCGVMLLLAGLALRQVSSKDRYSLAVATGVVGFVPFLLLMLSSSVIGLFGLPLLALTFVAAIANDAAREQRIIEVPEGWGTR